MRTILRVCGQSTHHSRSDTANALPPATGSDLMDSAGRHRVSLPVRFLILTNYIPVGSFLERRTDGAAPFSRVND